MLVGCTCWLRRSLHQELAADVISEASAIVTGRMPERFEREIGAASSSEPTGKAIDVKRRVPAYATVTHAK